LDKVVKVPGLANIWVPPIRNRIDMLATGIKSPVGVKVAGTDLAEIDRPQRDRAGAQGRARRQQRAGRAPDRRALCRRQHPARRAARFSMNIADVQSVITSAVGGENIGETVEGLQRFPINMRYPREIRDSLEKLRSLPIVTERGARLVLSDVADVRITDGPPMLRSENARLSGLGLCRHSRPRPEVGGAGHATAVAEKVKLPPGYSISWSGQFEFLERATAKLKVVVPFTLLIIFVLLYLTFKRFEEALLIMATLPFALVGGIWLLYLLDYNLSVAGAVGFIALAGVSAEFGVIMLLYLKHAWEERAQARQDGRREFAGCHPRRRSAARASQGHDRGRHSRGPVPDHVGNGNGVGSHAAHRRAHGRRDDHRAVAVDVRRASRLPADAPPSPHERTFMKNLVVLISLLAAALAAPAATPAQTASGPQARASATHLGVGVVRAVDAKERTLTISHQAMGSLGMPAMTMDFKVGPAIKLGELKEGDTIAFVLGRDGKSDGIAISSLQKVEGASAASPQAAAPSMPMMPMMSPEQCREMMKGRK
jgi:Cu/Ag efflux protein CusF